jgi:hypothetical protein
MAPSCLELDSKERLSEWQSRLNELVVKARDMYTGNQSRELIKGVDKLRKIERLHVTLFILSAGFGLVQENELIPPYDCSFSTMSKSQIINRSRKLAIMSDFQEIIKDDYDLVYLALGKNYLTALGHGWQSDVNGSIVVFNNRFVGRKYAIIPSGNKAVKSFSATGNKIHGATGFKGDLLRILADYALSKDNPYSEVINWKDSKYVQDLIFTLGRL